MGAEGPVNESQIEAFNAQGQANSQDLEDLPGAVAALDFVDESGRRSTVCISGRQQTMSENSRWRFPCVSALIAAGALLTCAPAWADAGGGVRIARRPALSKGVAAFPRIEGGVSAQAIARIDKSLDGADRRVRQSVKECLAQAGGHGDWTRSVSVAMAGPRFVSLVARDSYFCGGAYPDTSVLALVYDLDTGGLVDLQKLAPGLSTKTALDTAGDGSKIGTIASDKLSSLYREGAKRDDADPDCGNVLKDADLAFIAWPDAKAGGLVVSPTTLPHVVRACGPEVTIAPDALKASGADPALLEALASARK